jgi:hypothetical protein
LWTPWRTPSASVAGSTYRSELFVSPMHGSGAPRVCGLDSRLS